MKFLSLKKKIIFLVIIIFVLCGVYLFSIVSDIVRHGYDKQNKIILFVKSIISPHYVKIIRDNFFIIPNLKAKNEFLRITSNKI